MTAPPNDRRPPSSLRAEPAVIESPFLHAPEGARTIFVTTQLAALPPLLAGFILFGWRAVLVTALCLISCGVIEKLYYRVTRTPALLGRSHACLTALLLAMTLPAFVPWYVPVLASAFAIIVGKGFFGGVGHFLWQPALVGRLAVAVMFSDATSLPAPDYPDCLPVLARSRIVVGDVQEFGLPEGYRGWSQTIPPVGKDAILVKQPSLVLAELTRSRGSGYRALITYPPRAAELLPDDAMALRRLPPMLDMLLGRRGGGIGETCIVAILAAGLYLIYRNYIKWHLPLSFLAAAGAVVAFTPIYLATSTGGSYPAMPFEVEGAEVGVAYLAYHLFSGELVLAAVFLATEMTSRPVTTGGQVLFGAGCGALAMLLRLHLSVPIPCYMAVLAMTTVAPMIDRFWRPRVLGRKWLAWLRG
jgi:Na+-translocating ferredoxin:NAD+ oxidoreductase RnfD subunit